MIRARKLSLLLGVAGLVMGGFAQAASIYLLPSSQNVPLSSGTATFALWMDFTGVQTVGGGIDLDLAGPISLGSFAPSTYFTTVPDPAFTGYGTALADNDLEVHFGAFAGLTGVNKLGDLTVNLTGTGLGTVGLGINSFYGDFYNMLGQPMSVTLTGGSVNVVPVPAAAWLFLSAIGALGARRLRAS